MAEPASIFESVDEDTEARALAEGDADILAGRIVSHDEVVKWLKSWGKPDELPCPVPR